MPSHIRVARQEDRKRMFRRLRDAGYFSECLVLDRHVVWTVAEPEQIRALAADIEITAVLSKL